MKRIGQSYREKLASHIKGNIQDNKNIFLVSYTQLASAQMNDFRKSLKQVGASVYVSKNRIAQLALKELKQEELANKVKGQVAFVWADTDSASIAKILVKFTQQIDSLKVQGGLLDGSSLKPEDVKRLSELPSREVLLAKLLGTIQSPVSRLLGTFNAKSRDLLSILKQLSEKKGGK